MVLVEVRLVFRELLSCIMGQGPFRVSEGMGFRKLTAEKGSSQGETLVFPC